MVDEDLVDVIVDEQGVERAEAVEAGDRGAHEAFGGDRPGERGETADVGAYRGLGSSGLGGGGRGQGVHEALVDVVIVGLYAARCRRWAARRQAGDGEPGVDGAGDRRVVLEAGDHRHAERSLDIVGPE